MKWKLRQISLDFSLSLLRRLILPTRMRHTRDRGNLNSFEKCDIISDLYRRAVATSEISMDTGRKTVSEQLMKMILVISWLNSIYCSDCSLRQRVRICCILGSPHSKRNLQSRIPDVDGVSILRLPHDMSATSSGPAVEPRRSVQMVRVEMPLLYVSFLNFFLCAAAGPVPPWFWWISSIQHLIRCVRMGLILSNHWKASQNTFGIILVGWNAR